MRYLPWKMECPQRLGGRRREATQKPSMSNQVIHLMTVYPPPPAKMVIIKNFIDKGHRYLRHDSGRSFLEMFHLGFLFFFFPLFFLWVIYSVYKSQIKKEWWLRLFYLHSIDVLLTFLRVTHSCSWVVGLIRFLRDIRSLYWNTVRAHRPYSFDTKGHALD